MASREHSPLPESVRHSLHAIVFDTNSFPHGGLNLDLLREWGERASEDGLEVWMPEPVLWELAEHAAASWDAWQASTNRARKSMQAAGLKIPSDDPYSSRAEVMAAVDASVRSLAPSVRIIALDGDLAVEALRDQVQIRPPANKKSDVKTGAADSAWIRQVLRAANNDIDSFVIVGSDADVYDAFKGWDLPKPHMVPLHALHRTLFVLETPNNEIKDALMRFLQGVVGQPLEAGRTPDENLALGQPGVLTELVDEWEDDQIRDVELGRIRAVVGMSEVKISPRGLATAQVFLLVDAEYSGWRIDEDGTLVAHSSSIPQILVRDVLSFVLDGGTVTRARSETGQATASRADDQAYSDPSDALFELIDTLKLIPGAEEDLELLSDGTGSTTYSNGFALALEVEHGGGDPHWTATFTLSKGKWSAALEVYCSWDSLRAPYEDPDAFPAYVLTSDADYDWGIPAEWAPAAWVINHMWPPEAT
ncbi:hypothetical protein ACFV1C_15785 [Streptomyces sp. NPDC059605]|uniref:hypothetical protein n=1 Tax=unclassified Streptomyces TaxID=2593676 RepID=UPI0036A1E7DC